MPRWVFALIQFFPLSLFASYAFWHGAPDDARWEEAFKLASVAAVLQLIVVLPQSRPMSRLVLSANLYLLFGGLAFMTRQWWFLQVYDSLRESAIFVFMLGVGLVTMLATRPGYVAAQFAPRRAVVSASAWLLAATALALVISLAFRGDRYLAAVYPIIGLAILQRLLLHRLSRTYKPAANNSFNPMPLRGTG